MVASILVQEEDEELDDSLRLCEPIEGTWRV